MANKFIVKHRRGTLEQWRASEIIPEMSELVVELDEVNGINKFKLGDGVHKFTDLSYFMAGDEIVNQVLSTALPRIVTITLDFNLWQEVTDILDSNVGCYKQVVAIDGIGNCCRLDLQPDIEMLAELKRLGIIFTTENKGGTVTVYSVGIKPLKTYTMQAALVETDLMIDSNVILGIPVGASAVQPDWLQTDDTKLDFIKNKPTVGVGLLINDNQFNIDENITFIWNCGSSTEII